MNSAAQKNSALSSAHSHSRNARQQVCAKNELGEMETALRVASSHRGGVTTLAVTPLPCLSYSRDLRVRSPLGHSLAVKLPEKDNTFSGFFGEFIQTVIFGAVAALRLIVIPSKTMRDASPSIVKPWGISCPVL